MPSAREQMCRLVLRHQRRRHGGILRPIVVKTMMTVLPGWDSPPPALIRMLNWPIALVARQMSPAIPPNQPPHAFHRSASQQCANASCSRSYLLAIAACTPPSTLKNHKAARSMFQKSNYPMPDTVATSVMERLPIPVRVQGSWSRL
jgi:hypothetical protein